ncbi:MAG: hypothetical protein KGJ97_03765 [Xanthomonadaceae bacterium]|nr:hypothetical protein [Xanthomonadaceae bacterium]MDE3072162.1 hypothetical protein [Pseudomonadota bacterium]
MTVAYVRPLACRGRRIGDMQAAPRLRFSQLSGGLSMDLRIQEAVGSACLWSILPRDVRVHGFTHWEILTMHKTMFAAFITAAAALSVPAFAQVHLGGAIGGAGQIGAGVPAGGTLPNAVHAVDQVGSRADDAMSRIDQQARRTTRKTIRKARSAATGDSQANASLDAHASAHAHAAGANASAGKSGGLDTAALAGKAGEKGRGVGGEVRNAAHSAIQSSDRTAGSVGDAVKGINASGNANGNASGSADAGGNAGSKGGTKGTAHTRGHGDVAGSGSHANAGH